MTFWAYANQHPILAAVYFFVPVLFAEMFLDELSRFVRQISKLAYIHRREIQQDHADWPDGWDD